MAFVRLLATAQRLKKRKNDLVDSKEETIHFRSTGERKFKFKWIGYRIRNKFRKFKKRISYCFCGKKCFFNLKHEGSVENYVLKSALGFLSGLILTYLFFMTLVFQLGLKISTGVTICSVVGCLLVNGLAFSSVIRCVVLLTLPHFFGERGRKFIVAYALALVISGPAQNTLNNLGILSESLACGQEQLKSVLRQILDVIKKPFYAIKDAIKKVIETVKIVIKKIKEILIQIKRIIMAIIRVIKAAFMFLAKIINICNKELGTPFERCERVFDNAVADCNAKMGSIFSWMCSITYIVKSVCYLVKIFDYVCMIVDFISNSIIGVVIRKVRGFIRHIRTMFYVRIRFSHSFQFESKASKSIQQISKEIVAEIKARIKTIANMFKFIFAAAPLYLLFMLARVIFYRYNFLTNDAFDNKYLTEEFFQLDMRRAKHNKETVLPLNAREAKLYVKMKSTQLTDVESKKLKKAITTLASICIKAAMYMVIDVSLFWILNLIQRYGKFQSKVQAPNIPTPHISGSGLLADLLTSIVKAFQPVGLSIEIDTIPCLPIPIPPDYDRYIEIATLLILCWILTLLEPYGLRFRSYIMSYYYPLRGKQRAIWLYNNIMRKRSSFLKFARRQLRRKFIGSKDIEKVTLVEFLAAKFKLCGLVFATSQVACLLCGKIFRENDSEKPIRCQTPGCAGLYCEECFADLRNLCTVCLSPIEYGDLSDLSEERDSSEEERPNILKQKSKKRRKCSLFRLCKKKTEEDLDEEVPLYQSQEQEETEGESNQSKEELANDAQEQVDSGNASTESSGYSYSYQYSKDDQNPEPLETSSKDVEKQEILDYASMDSFRDEEDEEIISDKWKSSEGRLKEDRSESNESDLDKKLDNKLTIKKICTKTTCAQRTLKMEKEELSKEPSILPGTSSKEPEESDKILPEKEVCIEKTCAKIKLKIDKPEPSEEELILFDRNGEESKEMDKKLLICREKICPKIRLKIDRTESSKDRLILIGTNTEESVRAAIGSAVEDYRLQKEYRTTQICTDQSCTKINKAVQYPSGKLPKQTSTDQLEVKFTREKGESKVDIGTTVSGEYLRQARKDEHIDFIGVGTSDMDRTKKKIRRKKRRKSKTVKCSCSDSDEDGIEFWEKTSLVGVSTTSTSTARREDQSSTQHICTRPKSIPLPKISHFPDENETSDVSPYSSSSVLQALVPRREIKHRSEGMDDEHGSNERPGSSSPHKESRLRMFLKRVIPKYKTQRED